MNSIISTISKRTIHYNIEIDNSCIALLHIRIRTIAWDQIGPRTLKLHKHLDFAIGCELNDIVVIYWRSWCQMKKRVLVQDVHRSFVRRPVISENNDVTVEVEIPLYWIVTRRTYQYKVLLSVSTQINSGPLVKVN